MAQENQDDDLIRRYVLGRLQEAELEQLEERIMVDNEFFDQLLLAEDEMVEDYVNGDLPASDVADFKKSFLSTPEGRRQESYAKALGRCVAHHSPSTDAAVTVGEEPVTQEQAKNTWPEGLRAERREAEDRLERMEASRIVWWRRPKVVPYLAAAAAVTLVLLGYGIWQIISPSPVSKGLKALSQAYGDQRPFEARISGFNHAPAITTRGGDAKIDRTARNLAETILLDAVLKHPSAETHHAAGRLYLAEKKFDEAIEQFDEALKTDPNNAQLQSDYGTALLEIGKISESDEKSGKSLEEFAKALEHFNRALELDSSLLEALFNRGLCHERMKLTIKAEEDWRKYLENDANSKWSDEVRQHLKILEDLNQKTMENKGTLVQDFLNAYRARDDARAWRIASQNKEALAGKSISEQLLGAYLNASLEGRRDSADNMLATLSYLGELERQVGGDTYTSGLTEFYRSLSRTELSQLSEAFGLMALGKNYYLHAQNDLAIDAFDKAKRIYVDAGNEREALLADYYIAYSYPDKADIEHSRVKYVYLSKILRKRNFTWLLMRVTLGLSVADFSLNNYSSAINFANESLELSRQMDDANGALNALSCLVEYYRFVGNYGEALHCVKLSLPFIDPASLGIVQIWRHYAIVALALNSAAFHSAAIDYQLEALVLAQRTDNAATMCVSLAHLGLMYAKAGNFDEAIKHVKLAYDTARSCPDESVARNQMAYAALQMGHLYRQTGEFARALDSYDESTEIYKSLKFPTFLYQAHKGKLTCYIAQQNDYLATQEIQVALDMAEKYRATILEPENRNNFFDIEQSIYDLVADFEFSRMKNPDGAFEYAEKARARSLLDSLKPKTGVTTKRDSTALKTQTDSQSLPLATIEKQLAEDSRILQYAVLPNKILIWVISKDGCRSDEVIIDQNNLNEKVTEYMSLISSERRPTNPEELKRRGRALFDILLSKVLGLIEGSKRLCVVPDKVLASLPFDSLVSPDTNEYLIKSYEITYSPSASVFTSCSAEAKAREGAHAENVLTIGNPRFDRNKFALLEDLQAANAEAEGVAECYGAGLSLRLFGSNATKHVIEREITKYDIVHFASHAVPDETSPMRSQLVLAPDTAGEGLGSDSDGVLRSFEISKLNLPRTRLVVLSACQTGSGRYYNGEGMLSLARSFLMARVPLTLASLWKVDSESTKELMIRFHRHRKQESVSTAEALRRAQLDMLEVADGKYSDPHYWAAFVAIGGQTSY